jgi:hypothetical protein
VHGFTVPAYHAASDRRSRHALRGLLDEVMPRTAGA